MKESMKSSSISRAPVANLRQVKTLLPEDRPSRVGVKSKSSRSNAARSKNSLAWYVALNSKPSEEKISHIPQIKWKCPPKFALNTGWNVAAGEGSQAAETQRYRETTVAEVFYPRLTAIPPSPFTSPHVEGECSDKQTPIIPTIPIEEVAAKMPFDTSATVNASINSQLPASHKVPSVSGNLPVSQCVPSGPQDQPVCDKSLPDTLHGLESIDLEVAVAAAATVAAVMENKEQIDTELLIKVLTDPEMIKKLIAGNGLTAKPENGTPPAPEPNTPLPFPSSTPASVAEKVATECSEPSSRAILSNSMPQSVNQSLVLLRPKVGTEMVKKLIDGNGTAKLENRTPSAPEPNKPLPFPSSTPVSVVYKVATECNEPLSRTIPSNSMPQAVNKSLPLPCSKVEKEINKSASKQSDICAGSGPIRTSSMPVKKSNPSPRLKSYVPPVKILTGEPGGPAQSDVHQIARVKQVRPLMPSILRPDEETINRLVNKYRVPDIAGVMPVAPLNPCTSKPKIEAIKKMILEYGAPDAAGVKPVAPLIASTSRQSHMEEMMKTINEYGVGHGWGKPFIGPSPSLLAPTPLQPPGNFHFPLFSPGTTTAPKVDLNYYKSLIKQHGEKHETEEQKLPKIGQPGNYLQGLESVRNNTTSIVMNPKFRKPCIYFKSATGCRNGYNCQYQHDVSKQRVIGAMEFPVAKRMKFTEPMGKL